MKTLAYAAKHAISDLRPLVVERAEPKPKEVVVEVLFCGICHSDVHQVKNEWKNTLYPCVPGHEIVGRITRVGAEVKNAKVGQLVGVGCMVDSCGHCAACTEGLEQYCENGFLATYNGNQRTPTEENKTYGGYSEALVVNEHFLIPLPEGIDLASTGPLMCAGVTVYSPMKHWGVKAGTKVGVIGLGGLGHLAVKIGVALGAEVTVITTTAEKTNDAMALGAKNVIVSTDEAQMKANANSLDLILSTIPEGHDANPYMALVKRDGSLVIIGCLMPLEKPLVMTNMILDRKSLGSTVIGSIAETKEVLAFCVKHGIKPSIQTVGVDGINEAYKKVDEGEVDFRYVIDMATLKGKTEDESLAAKVGL